MKDFAKKHPVNKSKSSKGTATLRAKRELNQPLKIKHFFIVAGMAAILLISSKFLLQTDVKNLRGHVTNPTVEFFYPTDLEKDTVLIELEGIVTAENCEYLLQNRNLWKAHICSRTTWSYAHSRHTSLCRKNL